MSDEKKVPWGNALAVIPGRDENDRDLWIDLGPVWENENGFSFRLVSEPLAWRDSRIERRIVLQKRRSSSSSSSSSSGKGKK